MTAPRDMVCPECTEHVAPAPGSSWAIAWYSCATCGTFWYARLRVGPDAEPTGPRLVEGQTVRQPLRLTDGSVTAAAHPSAAWTLEELEAEADVLRKESEQLPAHDPQALRQHMQKLRVLADAINERIDALPPVQPELPF